MLYKKLQKRKEELGLTTEQLSDLSGVPASILNQILNGELKSPCYDVLSALESALFEDNISEVNDQLRESLAFDYSFPMKSPGEYTLEDYYAIPDEHRVELIDGVIYDMSAPSFVHQFFISRLTFEFNLFIRNNKGKCLAVRMSSWTKINIRCFSLM